MQTIEEVRSRNAARMRAWCKANPELKKLADKRFFDAHPGRKRDYHLRHLYGMSLVDFNEKLTAQSGGCAICGGPPGGKGVFHVDHDHKMGKIRGLLCHSCNLMLGQARDDQSILKLAIEYLSER